MDLDIGQIIKYNRKLCNLTQEQLCEGICSVTHMSKIENNVTHVSDEVVQMIFKRLNISIDSEEKKFKELKSQLFSFYKALEYKNRNQIDSLYKTLKNAENFIKQTNLYPMYQVCKVKYFFYHGDIKTGERLLKILERNMSKFHPKIQNYIFHLFGIYYLLMMKNESALKYLKTTSEEYREESEEYFYHLALVYSNLGYTSLSSYYSEKAIKSFKDHNNFERVFDAEFTKIIQLNVSSIDEREFIIEKYLDLLEVIEQYNPEHPMRARIFHNLGYEYLQNKQYEVARVYFEKSMNLKSQISSFYLSSLFSYINCIKHIPSTTHKELIMLIEKGYTLSDKYDVQKYLLLFSAQKYEILEEEENSMNFMEKTLLPYFLETNEHSYFEIYGKKLYCFYLKNNHYKKAVEIASKLLISEKN
ncbi:helix-turn-helix domain-containing protein [Bacillus spongiae]|uniref:Helix-turn-helix domain-containing protein n=1 Tax=Bacillus spongiae TaxID=2683610 RepID=A0ABU8HDT1_9BACI